MEKLLENITEALYVSNGDNVYLETKEDIVNCMDWYFDYGYNVAENLDVKYEDLPMTDEERAFWSDYKKILVAEKYNSEMSYLVLR